MSTQDLTNEDLIKQGKMLPLVEEFYSIQGEGFHTGKAAYFIRIGGCDIGCNWCDEKRSWDADAHKKTLTDTIIDNIKLTPAKSVVITGGEPMLCNLDYLCKGLKENGIITYLETSGSETLSGQWDWICVSPKQKAPVLEENLKIANELKVIIYEPKDLQWAEINAEKVNPECHLFLQPEWSIHNEILPQVIDYILNNPKWKLSNQMHKYVGIP